LSRIFTLRARFRYRTLCQNGQSSEDATQTAADPLRGLDRRLASINREHVLGEVRLTVELERSNVRIMLGQRVAEGVDDSRALAATVLFRMPPELHDTAVREFLGWVQGSHGPLVSEYMRAATIQPEASLGELTSFQRAALIGELRVRRRIAPTA
jgi:hypothetical protein